MNEKFKYSLFSLISLLSGIILLIFIFIIIGTFNKNKIVVTCLATTGPDFDVVFGNLKLKVQMPDSVDKTDVSGVMITDRSSKLLVSDYLNKTNAWEYNNYYVLTGKIIGAKKSDTDAFHPLIEVNAINYINKLFLWGLIVVTIGLLVTFRIMYKKFRISVQNRKTFAHN
jgi:hypothetical protein